MTPNKVVSNNNLQGFSGHIFGAHRPQKNKEVEVNPPALPNHKSAVALNSLMKPMEEDAEFFNNNGNGFSRSPEPHHRDSEEKDDKCLLF